MSHAKRNFAVVALLIVLTAGCAAAPQQGGMKDAQIVAPAFDYGYKAQRAVTKGAHFGLVVARSVYENPINRPVSHYGSLASYAIKSTGGMLRRITMSAAQMPALGGEIPEVSHAEPMDLVAFEKTLDKATGTRSSTGRIKFLVDGDEYFCRLADSIRNAEESVDIRSYIFDNDDFAVEVANSLKERSKDIRVRVMVDGLGNMIAMQSDPESMPLEQGAAIHAHVHGKRLQRKRP